MRTLLRFLKKYSNLFLFLLLEAVAITLMVRTTSFQRSRLVGLNRQVTGYLFSKVDDAREYLSLKEANNQLALENTALRNQLDRYETILDSAKIISEFLGIRIHTLSLEVFANSKHISLEDGVSVWVLVGVDGLREIDQRDIPIPIQDVVGREIAMHSLVG